MGKKDEKEKVDIDGMIAGVAQRIGNLSEKKKDIEREIKSLKVEYQVLADERKVMDKRCLFDGGSIEIVKSKRVQYVNALLEEYVKEAVLKKCRRTSEICAVRVSLDKTKRDKANKSI